MSNLPKLCDDLGLHLLVISEDLSYHFKFLDVVMHTADKYLADPYGNIDLNKFMQWWFADIETLREEQGGVWKEKGK